MGVGIDLGSSSVKVLQEQDASVRWRAPVDPELTARVGTTVPLVRRVGAGALVEAPHEVYVRELAHVLDGSEGDAVTVVVPVWWSDHARSLVERALQASSPVPIELDLSALAAVRAAAADHELPDTVAVLDVGAETTSAAVVTDVHGEPRVDGRPTVLAGRGGNELDRRLVQHVVTGLRSVGHRLDPASADDRTTGASLLSDARHAKEQLSIRPSVSLATQIPGSEAEVRIVRSEFDEIAEETVHALIGILHAAIEHAGERVAAVLLIGGGASIPLVSQRISTDLGLPVILDDEPATLAVRGAALHEVAAPPRPRRRIRRKAADPSRIVFTLTQPRVVPVPRTVAEPAPPTVVETPTMVAEPDPVPDPVVPEVAEPQPPAAEPRPAVVEVVEVVGTGTTFDDVHPLELVVETDCSASTFARTTTHWIAADGLAGTGHPEGRVATDGRIHVRIEGAVHPVELGAACAGVAITIVMLGLHVLITETATGNLLREVHLNPEHGYRPE